MFSVYVLLDQSVSTQFRPRVRAGADRTTSHVPAVLAALRQIDSDQAIETVRPPSHTDRAISDAMGVIARLLALLGVAGASLATLGVYGPIAQDVAERTREIGVRRALGASPAGVVALVLSRTGILCAAGLAVGFALYLVWSRALRGALVDIAPTDPATLALTGALPSGIALAACVVPARRAAAVHPAEALRSE